MPSSAGREREAENRYTGAMKRRVPRRDPFDLNPDDDLREWYLLTPARRFAESEKLWANFLLLGGTSDAGFDP